MTRSIDMAGADWRTSSHSGGGNQCVEVAGNLPGSVAVRDSNDRTSGGQLVARHTWRSFVCALKHGRI